MERGHLPRRGERRVPRWRQRGRARRQGRDSQEAVLSARPRRAVWRPPARSVPGLLRMVDKGHAGARSESGLRPCGPARGRRRV